MRDDSIVDTTCRRTTTLPLLFLLLCSRPATADVLIETAAPGHSATDVAASVTAPLEHALSQVPHLADMLSSSQANRSRIWLHFNTEPDIRDIRTAVQKSMTTLPPDLPSPPTFQQSGHVASRTIVSKSDSADRIAMMTGVAAIEDRGTSEKVLLLDAHKASALWLGVPEIKRGGPDVHLSDITLPHTEVPHPVFDGRGLPVVERVVWAQPDATLKGFRTLPIQRALVVSLRAPLRTLTPLAGPGVVLMESGRINDQWDSPSAVRVFLSGHADASRLRKLPQVATVGEAQVQIVVTPPAAARLVADRLRHTHELVAIIGGDTVPRTTFQVDKDKAAHLGVSNQDAQDSVAAATDGVRLSNGQLLRVADVQELTVSAGKARVPLSAVVTQSVRMEPYQVLHRNQFPCVILMAQGTVEAIKHDAGTVPGAVIEVSPVR